MRCRRWPTAGGQVFQAGRVRRHVGDVSWCGRLVGQVGGVCAGGGFEADQADPKRYDVVDGLGDAGELA
jgi:hypothetical protein